MMVIMMTVLVSLDASGTPLVNAGLEFVLSVRASVPNDSSLTKVQEVMHSAVVQIVTAVTSGDIQ